MYGVRLWFEFWAILSLLFSAYVRCEVLLSFGLYWARMFSHLFMACGVGFEFWAGGPLFEVLFTRYFRLVLAGGPSVFLT